jgi:tRNA(Ile)-lysidine synthase
VDSVVLLAALAERKNKRTRLRAVHIHHGLHPNADQWSVHCSALAKRLEVPLTTLRVKVPRTKGASLEASAREARYEALAAELAPDEVLLTAHHEDDQLETVLLQLMRGAGIAGLAAMPEVAPFAGGTLARPLLTRSRAELEAWARANELTWVDDDTNANEQFDRNYLRHRVLPLLRERWPAAAHAASRSARHAAEAKQLLNTLALADIERAASGASLSVQHLRALSPDRRRNAVRFWISRAGYPVPDTKRLDEITTTLLNARSDANPSVEWNGVHLRRHADLLTLTRAELQAPTAPNEEVTWNWRARPRIQLADSNSSLEIEPDPHGPIDLDSLPPTLTIRARQGGERLRPNRNGRTKTLKSLLQEARIPPDDRAHIPLIHAGERLVAVADRWLDASVHATTATRHRARIRWQRT